MMLRKQYLFYILIVGITIVVLSSCSSSKKTEIQSKHSLVKAVVFQKNPCFGNCAVYKLTTYYSGLAILEAKDHLDKKGVYYTDLSEASNSAIQKNIKRINWTTYKDKYFMNLPDLPSTDLNIYSPEGLELKKINSNAKLPDEIYTFQQELNELVRTQKWTQIQKKDDVINPEVDYSKIQVDMDSSVSVQKVQEHFMPYNLMPEKRLSQFMNLWLMSFDESKIGKYEMLIILRKYPGVRSVSFNRKLLPRMDE
ncbi:MAG: DUF6438 domain-containing protein [Bacteroidota bacterium]|nr:DUF6438 domain-containing protein [Bacteroidota bacterium]